MNEARIKQGTKTKRTTSEPREVDRKTKKQQQGKVIKKEVAKDIFNTETEVTITQEQDGNFTFLLSLIGDNPSTESGDFAVSKLDEAILEQAKKILKDKGTFNIEELIETYKEKITTTPPAIFKEKLSFPNVYHIINETFEANKQKEVKVLGNYKQQMYFSNKMTPLDFDILAVVYNLIQECLKKGQKYFSVRDVIKNNCGTQTAEEIKNVDFDFYEQKIIYLSRCLFTCQINNDAISVLTKKRNKQKKPTLTEQEMDFLNNIQCETETPYFILPIERLSVYNKKSGRKETAFKIMEKYIYLNILFKAINQFTTLETRLRRLPEGMIKKPEYYFLKSKILRFIQNSTYGKNFNKLGLTEDFNNYLKGKNALTIKAKQQALRRFANSVVKKILTDQSCEALFSCLKVETNPTELRIFIIKKANN